MRFLLKSIAVVLLALLCVPVDAQALKRYYFFLDYDLDTDSVIYGNFSGDATANENGVRIAIPIETSGSSATTTASTASTNPFVNVAEHDWIAVRTAPNTVLRRLVTAKADSDNVTVASAWDLGTAGLPFSWWDHATGTGADSGAITVADMQSPFQITMEYNQGDLGSLDARIECRVNTLQPQWVIVYPNETDACGAGGTLSSTYCNFVTAGESTRLAVVVHGSWDQCRVGLKYVTSDASDATTNREQISAYVTGAPRR